MIVVPYRAFVREEIGELPDGLGQISGMDTHDDDILFAQTVLKLVCRLSSSGAVHATRSSEVLDEHGLAASRNVDRLYGIFDLVATHEEKQGGGG